MAAFQPGRPITALITIKDAAGEPVNLATVTGVAIYIHAQPGHRLAQFSSKEIANYELIETVDASAGQVRIKVPGSATKSLRNTKIYIEAAIQIDNDGPYVIGMKDGKSIELALITNTSAESVPDLTP